MPHPRTRPTFHRSIAALALATALAALPSVAMAHVELVATDPEAGANLATPPSAVTLTFNDELDPDASSFSVTDHHGNEVGSGGVDLDVADRNVLAGAVAITEPGIYTVSWRVTGIDGHEISGTFSFGYATDEEIPEAEGDGHGHENPDTAMPTASEAMAPLPLAGMLLLLLAGAVAIRRAVVR